MAVITGRIVSPATLVERGLADPTRAGVVIGKTRNERR